MARHNCMMRPILVSLGISVPARCSALLARLSGAMAGRALLAALVVLLGAVTQMSAQKSGVGDGAASLPGGPGSLEGLGESFQPNLTSGTANHSISLAAPVGVAGIAPRLSLSYEGGGGNGLLGLGWSFAPGSIQRRTDKGIPRYLDGPNGVDDDSDGVVDDLDELDTFLAPSGEILVPVQDGPGTNFFCRVEGSFIRYRRLGDAWEGTSPDGRRTLFGLTSAARIVDPANPSHVFQWLAEKEIDTHGNTLEYRYAAYPGESNLNQKYLVEVRYGPGSGPWENFHFVAFDYEDRVDWFEDCRSGFVVRTGKRLLRVDVGTQGPVLAGHAHGDFNHDGIEDNLNHSYVPGYDPESYRTLLISVTFVGADGVTAFPPTTYAYTAASSAASISAEGRVIGSINEPVSTFETQFADLVDLNGDGLPDLIRTQPGGGGHFGYINQGQRGTESPGIQWGEEQQILPGTDGLAWSTDLGSVGTHLEDIDGDGLPDLVQVGLTRVNYFRNAPAFGAPGLSWGDRTPLAVQDFPPPAPFDDPDVRTADVNFDKRMDIIRSVSVGEGAAYQIWFNLGKQTYSSRVTVIPPRGYLFSQGGVQIGDFNGDRVPDVFRIRPSGIEVTAGLGYGRFSEVINVPLPEGEFLSDDWVAKARLEDVTGDGLADLILDNAEPGTLWFWVNQGNYTLASKRVITDLPAAVGTLSTRWADINGNGTTDLIIADTGTSPRLRIVDIGQLMGYAPRPNLLTQIRNGLGGVTLIEYRSSSVDMLADGTDESGAYRYRWPHAMPFPVEVMSSVTVSNSLGNSQRTLYTYHDAYYDPVEKQFRGFARSEKTELGDASAPSLITRFEFDVGDVQLALKGRLLRASSEQADGKVFFETRTVWGTRRFATGINGVEVRWPVSTRSISLVSELGVGVPRQSESETEYDDFGNVIASREWGIVEGGNRLAGNDERILLKQFAYDTNRWMLRFPVREELSDASGKVISRTDTFYDDETFSGANAGQLTEGNRTLGMTWYDLSRPDGFVRSMRSKYDSYGNLVLLLDPLGDPAHPEKGHSREFTHDDRFHQYGVREVQHVGGGHPDLVITARFDEGFGLTTQVTDANGQVSRKGYDAFGRTLWAMEPGDSADFPSREFAYRQAVPLGGGGLISYTETRSLDHQPGSIPGAAHDAYYHFSRVYLDGLGRTLLTKSEAEPDVQDGKPRWVAAAVTLFNKRGLPVKSLQSFFSGSFEFEDVQDPAWQGVFHVDGQLVARGLDDAPKLTQQYDAVGRVIRSVRPDGAVAESRFEPLVVHLYDENATDPASPHFGKHLTTRRDGLGRPVETQEVQRVGDDGRVSATFNTWTTRLAYRADGLLISTTDSQGNVKTKTYDGLGRVVSADDWDRGRVRFSYDDASNCLEREDAKGQVSRYAYDGINRRVSIDYLDDASPEFSYALKPDVLYEYDLAPAPVDQGDGTSAVPSNTLGRLTRVRDTQGDEFLSYDGRGRVVWQVRRLPDPTHGGLVPYRTAQEYDAMGRTTRLIYPDNDFVSFDYNERTLLAAIRGGPTGKIISARTYAPSSQEVATLYGNGVRSRAVYDSRMRMTECASTAPGGIEGGLIDYRYSFDAASNVRMIEDLRPPSALVDGDPRRNSQSFDYDSLYRLTGYQVSHAAPGSPTRNDGAIHYRYDPIGNLLEQTSTLSAEERGWSVTDLGVMQYGGELGPTNRVGRTTSTPGPHAMTRLSRGAATRDLHYDANGNMTAMGQGNRMSWDFTDHLVQFADDRSRAEYRYDFRGRRVMKQVFDLSKPEPRSRSTIYVSPAFEIRPNDEIVKYVFDGSRRVAQISGRINASARVHRMRLVEGWNLRSMTAHTPTVADALQAGGGIDALRIWNPRDGSFDPVEPGASASRGAVLWVHALRGFTLPLTGVDTPDLPLSLPAGGAFIGASGAIPVDLGSVLPVGIPTWRHDPARRSWEIHDGLTGSTREMLAPGDVVFTLGGAPATVTNVASFRIRYYHDDHLGSQTVVTDEAGRLVEETAYFPFGHPRHRFTPGTGLVAYGFGGKERDAESGLHHFEARYLSAALGRFVSVDPTEPASDPQGLNGYAYVQNRPTAFADPSGLNKTAPRPGRPKMSKEIFGLYAEGGPKQESYVSSKDWGPGMEHTVIKMSRFERRQNKVVLNKKGLLVHASTGRPLDTSEGQGYVALTKETVQQGVFMFVQTKAGHLYAAETEPGKYHHSSFTGGKAVAMAGEIRVKKGAIEMVNNSSGHYRPEVNYLHAFSQWLESHPNMASRRGQVKYETPVIKTELAPPAEPEEVAVTTRSRSPTNYTEPDMSDINEEAEEDAAPGHPLELYQSENEHQQFLQDQKTDLYQNKDD